MVRRSIALAWLAITACPLAGCSHGDDAPANVEGSYTIAITNGANQCQLQNWNEGAKTTGIPLTITQDGKNLMVTVEGAAGAVISVLLGSADYEGHVDGNGFTLDNFGTASFKNGSCAFTIKSTVNASISGDVIMGSIDYTPVTNDSPACGGLEACTSKQLFNGTRPPTTK
jgi:hypothetical protein